VAQHGRTDELASVILLSTTVPRTERQINANVKAKFRFPLPGKVEMSAFAVVIFFSSF
jgi:hypothetical protein